MSLEQQERNEWRDEFILSADVRQVGGQSRHYRSANSGALWRVARGAYLPGEPETDASRYLAQIRGRSLVTPNAVFSHASAARLWDLPTLGYWPDDVHIEVGAQRNGRSIRGLRRHRTAGNIGVEFRAGMRLTSLAHTTLDIAASGSLRTAVVVVDAALSGLNDARGEWVRSPIGAEALADELERRPPGRGSQQLRWALNFGDGRAGSPGESVSRLTMFQIGCPAPVLQHDFYDQRGSFVGRTDFWWPAYNLIGEFDGRGKYLRDEYSNARTPAQIVIDEKLREDHLRSLGPGMSRWVWEEALSARELRLKLTRAGLPCSK